MRKLVEFTLSVKQPSRGGDKTLKDNMSNASRKLRVKSALEEQESSFLPQQRQLKMMKTQNDIKTQTIDRVEDNENQNNTVPNTPRILKDQDRIKSPMQLITIGSQKYGYKQQMAVWEQILN